MTATLLAVALSLSLAQHGEPSPHGAVEAHAGAPAAHAAAEPHDESLGSVMMHHVADGTVLEFPGYCHDPANPDLPRKLAWICHLDLKSVFGEALVFHVGATRIDMTPTKHVVMMWLATGLLLLVVFSGLRRKGIVPRGLYNFVEMLVQFVRNEIAIPNVGAKDADRFVPYLVTVFFFILFVNLFGLIPFAATATANVSVTVALATFTFLITQYAAIRSMGLGGFLAHLTGGVPKSLWPLWAVMIPVEILGLFTKPFALTIRLFANMVAGHFVILALLGLIFALDTPWVAIASVPMALAIYLLEIFVAFVQAYIFAMLSALFIGAGLAHHGHDEHEEHDAAPAGAAHQGSHVAGSSPGHG